MTLRISSPVFKNERLIPKKYTCDGRDVNPPLVIEDVPNSAISLVLVVDDPDAPRRVWDHWIVWNIDPRTTFIPENSVPVDAVQGRNSFGKIEYNGPCPPYNNLHRYRFKLYAISVVLNTPRGSSKRLIEKAISKYIIERALLVGLYKR